MAKLRYPYSTRPGSQSAVKIMRNEKLIAKKSRVDPGDVVINSAAEMIMRDNV